MIEEVQKFSVLGFDDIILLLKHWWTSTVCSMLWVTNIIPLNGDWNDDTDHLKLSECVEIIDWDTLWHLFYRVLCVRIQIHGRWMMVCHANRDGATKLQFVRPSIWTWLSCTTIINISSLFLQFSNTTGHSLCLTWNN